MRLLAHYHCKVCEHTWQTNYTKVEETWPTYEGMRQGCPKCPEKKAPHKPLPHCLFLKRSDDDNVASEG